MSYKTYHSVQLTNNPKNWIPCQAARFVGETMINLATKAKQLFLDLFSLIGRTLTLAQNKFEHIGSTGHCFALQMDLLLVELVSETCKKKGEFMQNPCEKFHNYFAGMYILSFKLNSATFILFLIYNSLGILIITRLGSIFCFVRYGGKRHKIVKSTLCSLSPIQRGVICGFSKKILHI